MDKRQTGSLILLCFLFYVVGCKNKSTNTSPFAILPKSDKEEVVEEKQRMKSNLDTALWTEIIPGEHNIIVDMRYASKDNFMDKKIYPCSRCFLRPEVAEKVLSISKNLAQQNLRLRLFDCYRPAHFQRELWNVMPDWRYVAPPKKGSMHGRGLGIDLTLCDMDGNELDMGTPYDYFGREARHDYLDFPPEILENRNILKTTMSKVGFTAGRSEWWHYSLPNKFPLDSIVWNCN